MQSISVYLYRNKIDAYTNADRAERFRKVYNRNTKVYRGVDNRLDLQIKNSDQKPYNIGNSSVVFTLVDRSGKSALRKDCNKIDVSRGRLNVFITSDELLDLEEAYYDYALILEQRNLIDQDNYTTVSSSPLYIDSNYGAIGTIEVVGDVNGTVQNSKIIDKFSYTNPSTLGEPEAKFYISSLIDARENLTVPQTLHTFQIYPKENYSGLVKIQASLDENNDPKNWIDVKDDDDVDANIVLDDQSTPIYKNITGKFRWFRIYHEPDSAILNASFVVAQTILSAYDVSVANSGLGYSPGDNFVISGRRLGGESVTNDLTITITGVSGDGRIETFTHTGISYPGVRTFVIDIDDPKESKIDKILYR